MVYAYVRFGGVDVLPGPWKSARRQSLFRPRATSGYIESQSALLCSYPGLPGFTTAPAAMTVPSPIESLWIVIPGMVQKAIRRGSAVVDKTSQFIFVVQPDDSGNYPSMP